MLRLSRFLTVMTLMSATLVGSAFFSAPSYGAPNRDAQLPGTSGEPLFNNPGTGSSLMNVGALLGMGFASAGGGTQLVVGLNGDYKIMPTVGVGAYVTYNSLAALAPSSASLLTVMPQVNYYFEGVLTGFRAGAKIGVGFLNTDSGTASPVTGGASVSDTTTSFAIGPHIGYDYPIAGGFSIGGEGNINFYSANTGFNMINVLANAKLWF